MGWSNRFLYGASRFLFPVLLLATIAGQMPVTAKAADPPSPAEAKAMKLAAAEDAKKAAVKAAENTLRAMVNQAEAMAMEANKNAKDAEAVYINAIPEEAPA